MTASSPRRSALTTLSLLVLAAVPASAQTPDLATMFDLGNLVLDTNGDSVPDLVAASLVLGDAASTSEIAAAAEISARLGFETMAMDLPLARGDGGTMPIVIGRSGLAAGCRRSFAIGKGRISNDFSRRPDCRAPGCSRCALS